MLTSEGRGQIYVTSRISFLSVNLKSTFQFFKCNKIKKTGNQQNKKNGNQFRFRVGWMSASIGCSPAFPIAIKIEKSSKSYRNKLIDKFTDITRVRRVV